jgi:hypothetical protein
MFRFRNHFGIAALVTLLSLFGCKEDLPNQPEENTTYPEGTVQIDTNIFSIDSAFLVEYGANQIGVYNWDLVLVSSGLGFEQSTGMLDGMGSLFTCEFFNTSDSYSNIDFDIMSYSPALKEYASNGSISVDFNTSDNTAAQVELINSGSFKLSKVNDQIYKVTITGKSLSGHDFSVEYTGGFRVVSE